jgi:hypothetical protein
MTLRWRPAVYKDRQKVEEGRQVENPRIDAFLAEIETVCERHGLSISHEDGHGAFEVVDYDEGGGAEAAHDCTSSAASAQRVEPVPPVTEIAVPPEVLAALQSQLAAAPPSSTESDLPSVYKIASTGFGMVGAAEWLIEGPGLDPQYLYFRYRDQAEIIARALNQAYGIGHTFGRGAGR